jgi:hypothetical protein
MHDDTNAPMTQMIENIMLKDFLIHLKCRKMMIKET